MADSEEELRGDSKSRFFAPVQHRFFAHLESVPLKKSALRTIWNLNLESADPIILGRSAPDLWNHEEF